MTPRKRTTPANGSGTVDAAAAPAPAAPAPAAPRKRTTRASAPGSGSGTPAPESIATVIDDQLPTGGEASAAKAAVVPHPTVAERVRTGKVARIDVPREVLAEWRPAPDRADPVELLRSQEISRVQELVPVRHARMATSAFAFYRGAALLMAADLATLPRSGLNVQLCGDAHLSNFGLFAAPDRSVIFDVNDFDETNPGPFEWDVKRLATSFVLAARDNRLPESVGQAAAAAVASTYRESMARFADMRELDIWYDRVDPAGLVAAIRNLPSAKPLRGKQQAKAESALEGALAKARLRDAWSAIEKITEVVDGRRQFRNQPPLLVRLEMRSDAWAVIQQLFRDYRATLQDDRQELLKRYELVDMGHKVVGVGSVGLLAFVLLLRGKDENDLMVLQAKQAQSSVLEAYTRKSVFTKHGRRVVTGQRLMQAASDAFLGWIDGPSGRSFYVRQLRDMKWSPDPATLTADQLPRFAMLCGLTLARAHARAGDAVAVSAYVGNGRAFDKAITAFSTAYADQATQDYERFKAAIADHEVDSYEDASGEQGLKALKSMAPGTRAPASPKKR